MNNSEIIFLILSVIGMVLFGYKTLQVSNKQYRVNISSKIKSPAGFNSWLITIGIKIKPVLVIALLSSITLLVFSVLWTVFPGQSVNSAIGACTVLMMSILVISDLSLWKIKRIESGLIEALETLRSALSTGMSPYQAIRIAADMSRGGVKTELNEIASRYQMGCEVNHAVSRLLERYNSVATRLFAQTLIARDKSGGDLGYMLSEISNLLQERTRQRLKMDAQLSGTRYASIFSGLLPYLLVPLFYWQEPTWFESLLNHPKGATYLSIAMLLQLSGFIWLRKILRSPV